MENMTQKSKVLYIITKSNWGGAQRYVYDLATNLPRERFEVSVALGGSGPLADKLSSAGIEVLPIGGLERDVGVFKEFRAFVNIFKIIRNVRPDIIHLNSSKAGGLGTLAARLLNLSYAFLRMFHVPCSMFHVHVIFTAHGWAFKEKRRNITKKLIEYASWCTMLLSDVVIVVSQDDREKVNRFLWVQKRIHLVYNGITTPTFKSRDEARGIISKVAGTQIEVDTLLVGSIGELHRNKGFEYALAAFGSVIRQETTRKVDPSKLRYIIVGEGEEHKSLKEAVVREGQENVVRLVGQIPNAAELLRAFDIFLIPSLKEGLPYALLEAGAAGLATIASDVGGITEVISDMHSGIVVRPKRPRELADALAFLIEHTDKRKEFGERLAKTVEEKFTLERMIKETVSLYSGLLVES